MQADLLEHPAVKAWIKLQPDRLEPHSIEILDGKSKKDAWMKLELERAEPESIESLDRKARAWIRFRSGWVQHENIESFQHDFVKEKRFVYRLKGVGPEGSAVIAKQCERGDGVMEHTIYRQILSHLPVPTLRCYGFVEEPRDEFCWLFLEDAGTEVFRFHSRDHRALAARWLGLMHTSAVQVAGTVRLPDRGPDYYLEHLQLARDTIQRTIVNSTLSPDDLVMLESIVSQCNILESCWSKVERVCDKMPQTLVHNDFAARNIKVRNGQAGTTLLPFDWEKAGWGIPAADLEYLEQADLAMYWSVVHRSWPYLEVQDIEQMANLGKIFRGLAAISWERWHFEYSWENWPSQYSPLKHEMIKGAVMSMKVCEGKIADAMLAATWYD